MAVEMPGELRVQFKDVQAQLQRAEAHVNWVEPHNIHVTLKFLGEIGQDQLEGLYEGVSEGVRGLAPFEIGLSGLGAFPNFRRPRVVWIGVERGRERLVELQRRLEESIGHRGFPRDNRKFSPHLTIGRVKSPRGVDDLVDTIKATPFESGSIRVDEVVVMKSTLTPEGPIYASLRRIGL